MSHAIANDYAPAFPLGQPLDGRHRYGMTPEQAALYRWLLKNRPHDRMFNMQFREIASATGCSSMSALQERIENLVARGWLHQVGRQFAFVHPVKHFKVPR